MIRTEGLSSPAFGFFQSKKVGDYLNDIGTLSEIKVSEDGKAINFKIGNHRLYRINQTEEKPFRQQNGFYSVSADVFNKLISEWQASRLPASVPPPIPTSALMDSVLSRRPLKPSASLVIPEPKDPPVANTRAGFVVTKAAAATTDVETDASEAVKKTALTQASLALYGTGTGLGDVDKTDEAHVADLTAVAINSETTASPAAPKIRQPPPPPSNILNPMVLSDDLKKRLSNADFLRKLLSDQEFFQRVHQTLFSIYYISKEGGEAIKIEKLGGSSYTYNLTTNDNGGVIKVDNTIFYNFLTNFTTAYYNLVLSTSRGTSKAAPATETQGNPAISVDMPLKRTLFSYRAPEKTKSDAFLLRLLYNEEFFAKTKATAESSGYKISKEEDKKIKITKLDQSFTYDPIRKFFARKTFKVDGSIAKNDDPSYDFLMNFQIAVNPVAPQVETTEGRLIFTRAVEEYESPEDEPLKDLLNTNLSLLKDHEVELDNGIKYKIKSIDSGENGLVFKILRGKGELEVNVKNDGSYYTNSDLSFEDFSGVINKINQDNISEELAYADDDVFSTAQASKTSVLIRVPAVSSLAKSLADEVLSSVLSRPRFITNSQQSPLETAGQTDLSPFISSSNSDSLKSPLSEPSKSPSPVSGVTFEYQVLRNSFHGQTVTVNYKGSGKTDEEKQIDVWKEEVRAAEEVSKILDSKYRFENNETDNSIKSGLMRITYQASIVAGGIGGRDSRGNIIPCSRGRICVDKNGDFVGYRDRTTDIITDFSNEPLAEGVEIGDKEFENGAEYAKHLLEKSESYFTKEALAKIKALGNNIPSFTFISKQFQDQAHLLEGKPGNKRRLTYYTPEGMDVALEMIRKGEGVGETEYTLQQKTPISAPILPEGGPTSSQSSSIDSRTFFQRGFEAKLLQKREALKSNPESFFNPESWGESVAISRRSKGPISIQ